MKPKSKKNKQTLAQKIALSVFIRAIPELIKLWKERAPEMTFDEFLMIEYENALSSAERKKIEHCSD